jgi:hypothetical protein
MTKQDRELRARIKEAGIDVPENIGPLVAARWTAYNGYWYVQTKDERWYWYDSRDRTWKHTPMGPL